ncbi:MAG TPA: TrkA family potassium uptake protein [Actinomycetes bacterium]|nr:TrkA family potassium uptake protein [Actinomycetes bacterium]
MFSLVDRKLTSPVLVVGLGRFGSSLALSLVDGGREVMAVDSSPERVQHYADRLTHVIQLDTTDEEAMRQIGAGDFAQAIVAIGSDIESSVLTTALLADMNIQELWAKAISREHGRILERIGAHHVVYPEADMGERVAHLVSGAMLDYIQFDDEFALAKLRANDSLSTGSLGELGLRAKYGITVVGVRPPHGTFTYADRQTRIEPGALIAVAGRRTDVDRFARELSDHD